MKKESPIEILLLSLIGFLPPIFVLPGKILGQYSFTLYREPKLYLIAAMTWLLFALGRPKRSAATVCMSAMALLALLSILWAPVKMAAIYEAFQYLNLAALSAGLAYFFQIKKFRLVFICSLILGMSIAVSIGILQWEGVNFSILIPIGIAYPSTFGARHSAALAVCGSMFLTLIPLSYCFQNKKYLFSLILTVLFLLQTFYVLILGSRTAYFGGLIGTITVGFIGLRYLKEIDIGKKVLSGIIVLVFIASAVFFSLSLNRYVKDRIEKTVFFVEHPTAFFKTERWIWWSNSFQMIKDNPFGVGAGNWGFLYPVYRRIGKSVYYSENTQVRRTHNDYLQILCELGPIGFLVFLILLFKALWWSWVTFKGKGVLEAAYLVAQISTWAGLMCFDYPFEMPFQRFLLIALLILAEGVFYENLA